VTYGDHPRDICAAAMLPAVVVRGAGRNFAPMQCRSDSLPYQEFRGYALTAFPSR
jgi:hypothetical protein